tara:strand:- start:335 stop:598 length:264 start_codon:yes stop_codon:yes gene_type:complete
MGMISPNDMITAAKDQMIDGREPTSDDDWILIANFVLDQVHDQLVDEAANIASGLELVATPLVLKLYDSPLDQSTVEEIAKFQARAK